jgi:hypothetical protein
LMMNTRPLRRTTRQSLWRALADFSELRIFMVFVPGTAVLRGKSLKRRGQ